MKAKDLFIIILRIFGIYLIKDVIITIPPVLRDFILMFDFNREGAVITFGISLLMLGFYLVIVWVLLFRTSWLISKLNLLNDLSLEPLPMNLHRSSVYTIAIIISGLLILVFSVPSLVKQLYLWYQFVESGKFEFGEAHFNFEPLILSGVEVIIGLLFLGNQRLLVNFVESRRRLSKKE